jgi:hypothetical protein
VCRIFRKVRSYFAVGIVASLALFASTIAHGQQPAPGPVYGPVPGPGAVPVLVPAPARVIEQDLFVTDPTVAARQHWLIGVGGEGWLTAFPEWPYVDVLSNTLKTTTTYFHNFGGNVTIGYDDFWVQFNYRTGKGTQSQDEDDGIVVKKLRSATKWFLMDAKIDLGKTRLRTVD